jgi:Mlc titration factor MtfA (ptsG expression regulator)
MWGWFRQRRRRKWQELEFPTEWEQLLNDRFSDWARLSEAERVRLRRWMQVFIREKNWEGCGGQAMTEEVKVIVSAQAGLMVLGLDDLYFDHVLSILVYPDAYRVPGATTNAIGIVDEWGSARMGEAWWRGPVILSWRHSLSGAGGEFAENLVCHEFAHQLDMMNGRFVNGTPPLESAEQAEEWQRVMSEGYRQLSQKCRQRRPGVIRCYGMTNPGEFFAVATEAFFASPRELREEYPAVYQVLKGFYKQDPADWKQHAHNPMVDVQKTRRKQA